MDKWRCCNVEFNTLREYLAHLKYHENVQNLLLCNLCGEHCKGWISFKTHYRLKHKEHALNQNLNTPNLQSPTESMEHEHQECN